MQLRQVSCQVRLQGSCDPIDEKDSISDFRSILDEFSTAGPDASMVTTVSPFRRRTWKTILRVTLLNDLFVTLCIFIKSRTSVRDLLFSHARRHSVSLAKKIVV